MSDLTSFIKNQFDAAWNAHDLDRVMGYFAADAVLQTVPPLPAGPDVFRGKAQVRGFVEMLMPGFHVDSSNYEQDGNRISWFSTVSCDAFRQMGLDALDARATAVVQGGTVTSFQAAFTPSALARMRAAQNKAVMHQIYDAFNTGDLDALDALVAVDAIEHEAFPGLSGGGLDAVKQFISMFRAAFPDFRFEVEDMIAEGDRVVTSMTMHGTHRGPFLDIPATGRRIEVPSIDIVRFADGKAVEHWAVTDTMTMMQQLGVLPEEEAA